MYLIAYFISEFLFKNTLSRYLGNFQFF